MSDVFSTETGNACLRFKRVQGRCEVWALAAGHTVFRVGWIYPHFRIFCLYTYKRILTNDADFRISPVKEFSHGAHRPK